MYQLFKFLILVGQVGILVFAVFGFVALTSSDGFAGLALALSGYLLLHLAAIYVVGELMFALSRYFNAVKDGYRLPTFKGGFRLPTRLPTLHSIISKLESPDIKEVVGTPSDKVKTGKRTTVDNLVLLLWLIAAYPLFISIEHFYF